MLRISAALLVAAGCSSSSDEVSGTPVDAASAALIDQPAPVARPKPSGWGGIITSRVVAAHYAFGRRGEAVTATNHAQGLAAAWDRRGVSVTPLAGADTKGITLGLVGFGRAGQTAPAAAAAPVEGGCRSDGAIDTAGVCLTRLEATRGGLVEWWENRPDGIEHGFTLAERPAGSGPLQLDLAVGGATVTIDANGDDARLAVAGRDALQYRGLHAWDANHRPLDAHMETAGGGLRLVVDDASAVYPITIDPVISATAAFTLMNPGTDFGLAIATGLVNEDAFPDVVVGAPRFHNGSGTEGRVFVFLGTASGVSTTTTSAWTAQSQQAGTSFASSVAVADLNCDGHADVLVGDPLYDNPMAPPAESEHGAVFLYRFSTDIDGAGTDGLLDPGEPPPPTPPLFWALQGGQDHAHLGTSVAATNVDGLECADAIIGAPDRDGHGAVYVYRGSTGGLKDISEAPAGTWTVSGAEPGARFGAALAVGDLDGDADGDVVVGAPDADDGATVDSGAAFAYASGSSGLPPGPPLWSAHATIAGGHFGAAVAVGQLNAADTRADVVVGAPGGIGMVSVYQALPVLDDAADWATDGTAGASFGAALAPVGDLDGDGRPDLVVGAPDEDGGQGATHVFLGTDVGLDGSPLSTRHGTDVDDGFGATVVAAGDLDDDGYADVLVGAPGAGQVLVFTGECSTATWYRDRDEDGHGSMDVDDQITACAPHEPVDNAPNDASDDPDESAAPDYVTTSTDCDDADAEVNPAQHETPGDEIDQDCDGHEHCYVDEDLDGHGGSPPVVEVDRNLALEFDCAAPGVARINDDCDDADADISPGLPEVCDDGHLVDEDCDGLIDDADGSLSSSTSFYRDFDGDGAGDASSVDQRCEAGGGYIADDNDCDDRDASIHPGGTEVCDGGDDDEDCDGEIDEADGALNTTNFYDDGGIL